MFHFAPATVSNLSETNGFIGMGALSQTNYSSIQSQELLHMHATPLQHIYCIGVIPTPTSSLSKEAAALTSILDSIGGPKTNQSFCKVCIPLSNPCERELIQDYYFPRGNQTGSNLTGTLKRGNSGTDFVSDASGNARASCIDLLPDDSTNRVNANSKESLLLRNSYVLIGSEIFEEISGETFHARDNGQSNNNSDTIRRDAGFYLVQFNEKNSMYEDGHPELQSADCGGPPINDNDILLHLLHGDIRGLGRTEGGKLDKKGSVQSSSDVPILSTVCRWRSCLSESCPESGNKFLCKYHQELRIFLDGPDVPQGGGKSAKKNANTAPKESSKYISKKSMMNYSSDTVNRDLKMMRNASTLIQELWDGKLAATVQSFAQKTCVDMGMRKRLENTYKSCNKYSKKKRTTGFPYPLSVRPRPAWARWRNEKEFERYVARVTNSFASLSLFYDERYFS